jgi:hypothetical protein
MMNFILNPGDDCLPLRISAPIAFNRCVMVIVPNPSCTFEFASNPIPSSLNSQIILSSITENSMRMFWALACLRVLLINSCITLYKWLLTKWSNSMWSGLINLILILICYKRIQLKIKTMV